MSPINISNWCVATHQLEMLIGDTLNDVSRIDIFSSNQSSKESYALSNAQETPGKNGVYSDRDFVISNLQVEASTCKLEITKSRSL